MTTTVYTNCNCCGSSSSSSSSPDGLLWWCVDCPIIPPIECPCYAGEELCFENPADAPATVHMLITGMTQPFCFNEGLQPGDIVDFAWNPEICTWEAFIPDGRFLCGCADEEPAGWGGDGWVYSVGDCIGGYVVIQDHVADGTPITGNYPGGDGDWIHYWSLYNCGPINDFLGMYLALTCGLLTIGGPGNFSTDITSFSCNPFGASATINISGGPGFNTWTVEFYTDSSSSSGSSLSSSSSSSSNSAFCTQLSEGDAEIYAEADCAVFGPYLTLEECQAECITSSESSL